MSRPLIPALLVAIAWAAASYAQPVPAASSYAVNQRASIRVNTVEQAHILTEMNGFMQAIHDINTALAARDFARVASLAEAMGPKGGQHDAVGKQVHEKLPQEWFALARPTHQRFLDIARQARDNPTLEAVMPKVAATTQQCVACHSTFRLTVTAP